MGTRGQCTQETSCSYQEVQRHTTHTKASRQGKAKWQTKDTLGIELSPGPGFRNGCEILQSCGYLEKKTTGFKKQLSRIIIKSLKNPGMSGHMVTGTTWMCWLRAPAQGHPSHPCLQTLQPTLPSKLCKLHKQSFSCHCQPFPESMLRSDHFWSKFRTLKSNVVC